MEVVGERCGWRWWERDVSKGRRVMDTFELA